MQTDHGPVETPIFMPVGTAAAMKGIFHRDLRDDARARIILANTYHLYLRPGMRIMEQAGLCTFDAPDKAVLAAKNMCNYAAFRRRQKGD